MKMIINSVHQILASQSRNQWLYVKEAVFAAYYQQQSLKSPVTVPSRTQTHNSTKVINFQRQQGWLAKLQNLSVRKVYCMGFLLCMIFSRELINPIGHQECVCICDDSLSQTMGPLIFGLSVGLYWLSGVCTRFEPNHLVAGSRLAPAGPARR